MLPSRLLWAALRSPAQTAGMVLPLAKLGTLVLRTLSKPVANRLKQQASHHPRFREVIIKFAQVNHRLQVTLQRRIYNRATDVEIRPLNEEKAVKAASDFIGEVFIITVAGGVVIYEVSRNARSEARKEGARKQHFEDLRKQVEIGAGELEALRARVEELESIMRGHGKSSWIPGFGKREEKGDATYAVFPQNPPTNSGSMRSKLN